MTKRAYKLQEFVAHTSNVNCLTLGKKSSRVLVTGGEDQKVNMWAIGKPNAILSLSGHTSAVESVTFDASEVLVVAGAASGTIKLWDLEEAKIVRTLTGHRSNCISVSFHPFGEFFASGSLDTNLKIWDIRRKGCIHTYKGHTRGINTIKFSPDGRWVVSGGEDNSVKLWDLTAGKLMHDFKLHEGQIQCLDFHPHEFLLATGAADRTVKFWDLETFELIGSAGPELATGVRAMTFNPDGRTLLCAMHDSLKVLSWEPVRCHDVVDVGWSKLADLSVHEGKLIGCSYQQSCVGVWVVDLVRVSPFHASRTGTLVPGKLNSNGHQEKQHSTLSHSKSNGLKGGIADNLETALASSLKELTVATNKSESTNKISENFQNMPPKVNAPLISTKSTHPTSAPAPSSGTPRRPSSTRIYAGNVVRSSRSDVFSTSQRSDVFPTSHKSDVLPTSYKSDVHPTSHKSDVLPTSHKSDMHPTSHKSDVLPTSHKSDMHPSANKPDVLHKSNKSDVLHKSNKSDVLPKSNKSDMSLKSNKSDVLPTSNSVSSSIEIDRHSQPSATVSEDSNSGKTSGGSVVLSGRSDQRSLEGLRGDAGADAMRIDTSPNAEVTSSNKSVVNGEKGTHDANQSAASHTSADNGASHRSADNGASHRGADNGDDLSYNDLRKFKRSNSFVSHRSDALHRSYGLPLSHAPEVVLPQTSRPTSSVEASTTGRGEANRMQGLIAHWDRKERPHTSHERPQSLHEQRPHSLHSQRHATNGGVKPLGLDFNSFAPRGSQTSMETNGSMLVSDEELIEKLMEQHHTMTSIMQSRLTNMQVVRRFWMKNDVKGAVEAMAKLADPSVLVDVLNVLMERSSVLSLEVSGLLLPLLNELLCGNNDRHILTAIELVNKLVKTFGQTIHAAISATPSLGVDLQAEQRLERCKVCHQELLQVSRSLVPLTRKGGDISKSAQELSVVLQEILET